MAYYNLGAVKPWVKAAAEEVGPKFGIKTVYGWAPGKYDHPKGLALDFMTVNIPNGKAAGDALVAYVIANSARLGVTYIIWQRQSWNTTRRTWQPYSGDSPHIDHVHVSFVDHQPTGGPTVPSDPTFSNVGLTNPLDALKEFGTAARWLSDSHNWLRILYVLVGAALITGIIMVVLFAKPIEVVVDTVGG